MRSFLLLFCRFAPPLTQSVRFERNQYFKFFVIFVYIIYITIRVVWNFNKIPHTVHTTHENWRHHFLRTHVDVWIERTNVVGPDVLTALHTDKDEHELLATRRRETSPCWRGGGRGISHGNNYVRHHNTNYGLNSTFAKNPSHSRRALAHVWNRLTQEEY